ncbi:MoaD/ThiS family protein [Herbiconiux moechotypicola]|uniref:Molybdopterin synthase subunit MoaD2 n=1 Tax=Herbiconiux moechotypicola TaxID=637393 RepID=A0ABN3E707_9MICO|nr:MoaD/ThiS family protein [Herbiconiux moechotypicola]MCS5731885.1 MoaD/ThiS family protein [Herbiconiux moechotypicola]
MGVAIRYFAAAKAALGTGGEERTGGVTIAEALAEAAVAAPSPEVAAAVLARCSFLHNRVATTDRAITLADGDTLDVLPPFAGG